MNSRLALETGELIRARAGHAASNAFHHAVMRAFFAERANVADLDVLVPLAAPSGVTRADIEQAWAARSFRTAVDDSIRASFAAGVTGVPAYAWEGGEAVAGMRKTDELVALLERLPHGVSS